MIIEDLKREKEFKEAIGGFVIQFSELEFGLAKLCSLTECSLCPNKRSVFLEKYMGFTFVKKIEVISKTIKEEIPELQEIWSKIEPEIRYVNDKRRYIIHGIISYSFQEEFTIAHIKTKNQVSKYEIDVKIIDELTIKIVTLNTGKYGIGGHFRTLFTKAIIDQWNDLVSEKHKIVYSVNNKILSEWKGGK